MALQCRLVRRAGLEPAQPFGHQPLKLACLPIPPPARNGFSLAFERQEALLFAIGVPANNKAGIWRKWRDSNPRTGDPPPVFKTGAFDRSATLPYLVHPAGLEPARLSAAKLKPAASTDFARGAMLAEREGFEPPEGCPSPAFETGAFGRSAISPELVAPEGIEPSQLSVANFESAASTNSATFAMWCLRPDSNGGPRSYEDPALTAELQRRVWTLGRDLNPRERLCRPPPCLSATERFVWRPQEDSNLQPPV